MVGYKWEKEPLHIFLLLRIIPQKKIVTHHWITRLNMGGHGLVNYINKSLNECMKIKDIHIEKDHFLFILIRTGG